MNKVLHYKTNFLNKSETFIDRLVRNHINYTPIALCYRKKFFTENLKVFEVPKKGVDSWLNFTAFHANLSLPYYRQVLKQEKPDLIHAHFGFDAVKLIQLSKEFDIPLVVSFYGSDVSRLPSELGWKKRYRKLAAHAAHFISATEFMKSQLIGLGFPEQNISIIRFGVDLNGSNYLEKSLTGQKMMIAGRMVEKKGFEYAIRAVSELKKRGIEIELNVYGFGPRMNALKSLAKKLNISERVFFHGYQPVEHILKAHHEHTIFLAPSITASDGDMEGLPNTILEAMAKGTTVIATKHAAIPEVIEDKKTGFLVEERNVHGLTRAIESIIRGDFDLNEIRRNARTVIEEKYGIHRMVREIENIYNQATQ